MGSFPKIEGDLLGSPKRDYFGVYIEVPLFWETTIIGTGDYSSWS